MIVSVKQKNDLPLELSLIIIIVGLACLMYQIPGVKMVVLNLFFLPVLLGAFFLGRYRAGVLALLSVVLVTIIAAQDFSQFAAFRSPLTSALAITIWGGVLGLATILAGTLSDERATQTSELHAACLGVIEVLSSYLHGAHPQLKDRPARIAELSQRIGAQLHLNSRDLDDIRVAALLQEMADIEITVRVMRKAVGDMDGANSRSSESTFKGADLVQSLGEVISGTLPLLRQFDDPVLSSELNVSAEGSSSPPIGAQIIRTARTYDRLVFGQNSIEIQTPGTALRELNGGLHGNHLPEVLRALEQIVLLTAAEQKVRPATVVKPAVPGPRNVAAL